MTIDNMLVNNALLGGFIDGEHGAVNQVDHKGKQHGYTARYYFEGRRSAAYPTIAFARAYFGNGGNITPIDELEFEVLNAAGAPVQHVAMRNCVVTAWRLCAPQQPQNDGQAVQAAVEDYEFVRIESADVTLSAGGQPRNFVKVDPNAATD